MAAATPGGIMAATDLVPQEETRTATQLLLDLEIAGAATDVALTITDPDLPYEQWEALGRYLGQINRRARWYIGDWLNFGEAAYGEAAAQGVETSRKERYSQAERVTGLDHGTLMNYRSVCEAVKPEVRREELGITIHAEVAKFKPPTQRKWLNRAVKNGWNREQLREAIKAATDVRQELSVGGNGSGAVEVLPPPSRVSQAERLVEVASLIFHQAQRLESGDALIPSELFAQLGAALGEE